MKNTKNKSTFSNEPLQRVLGMGNIDLTYTLNLSEDDVKKYKIDISKIETLDDIGFLEDAKNLWTKIFISSDNPTLMMLLFLNRTSENKLFIEYLSYKLPFYDEKEKAMGEMINTVNELNFLFILPNTQLFPEKGTCKITFIIKFNDESKSFTLGDSQSYEDSTKNNDNKGDSKEEEKNQTFIDKIKLSCKAYDYFITNIEDASTFESIDDYIDMITGLKMKYNSNIIIKYTDISSKYSSHDDMMKLNRIYLLTDTFLFNSKDALANFKQHYKEFNTNKKNSSELTEKKINDYFISYIACGGQLSLLNSKVSVIIDESLSKLTIIEVPSNGKNIILKYDIKPYPKINHTNVDLVEKYKSTLRDNVEFYSNLFNSGFLSKFIASTQGKSKDIEGLYPCYLAGVEIVKRILELKIKDCELPLKKKFYTIRLSQEEIDNYVKNYYLNKKEGKFVLDCTNPQKAKMKSYVPLFDYNLHQYFGKETIKKDLKEKGFINSKGFVYFDPLYREEMIPKIAKRKQLKELDVKEQHKLIIKKQLEENNPNSKKILNNVDPTIKKLPTEPCETIRLMNMKRCPHLKGLKCNYQKCNYCVLREKSKKLEMIEEEKRKKLKLRQYE